jgi:hypothetical protein
VGVNLNWELGKALEVKLRMEQVLLRTEKYNQNDDKTTFMMAYW